MENMKTKAEPLMAEHALSEPPAEYQFKPAGGNLLEGGKGVTVSGFQFTFQEIDTVGRDFKELTDVLAEVARDEAENQKDGSSIADYMKKKRS